MRLLLAAVLSAALAFGCTSEPQPSPPAAPDRPPLAEAATSAPGEPTPVDPEWTVRADAGGATLSQVGAPPGPCAVTARRDGAVLWAAPVCLARRGQPIFLGPDGETAVVLERFVPRGEAKGRIGPVVLVSRRGEPVRSFLPEDLSPSARLTFSDAWLATLGQGDGAGPELVASGQAVRFATAGGPIITLHFDGRDWPRSAAERQAAARKGRLDPEDEATLYRWEDAGGQLHFTLARDVPPALASKARPVTADIGTVTSDPRRPVSSRSAVTATSPGLSNGSMKPYRPEAPGPSQGPRLNGLTDAEREVQERSRAQTAERARKAEEEQATATRRRDRDAAFGAATGVGVSKVNTARQVCTRKGDIVECRNAP